MKERSASRLRVIVAAAIAIACSDTAGTPPPPSPTTLTPRTFRMGFSALSPKPTNESVVATLNAWSTRADAAIIHTSVPYNALLSGTTATAYETAVDLALVNTRRSCR